jgi:ubiquinone/menaquinone biosynthesis C-methylase UbiE
MGTGGTRLSRDAEITFEAFAPAYDDFTAHHNYGLWQGSLLPELERHGLKGQRLLDVACGTGKSFLWMLEQGWEVVGCDISPSMLELARAKASDSVQLIVADMRELPELGQFDLVWALCDALNYLLDTEELALALQGMRRNLAPGGLLVFDLNTLVAYRTFYAEREVVEKGGRRLVWQGHAPSDVSPGSLCEARVESDEAGSDGMLTHVHRQRHFPPEDVLAAMASSGLECLEIFGHGEDAVFTQPLDELAHTKAVYVARALQSIPVPASLGGRRT